MDIKESAYLIFCIMKDNNIKISEMADPEVTSNVKGGSEAGEGDE